MRHKPCELWYVSTKYETDLYEIYTVLDESHPTLSLLFSLEQLLELSTRQEIFLNLLRYHNY